MWDNGERGRIDTGRKDLGNTKVAWMPEGAVHAAFPRNGAARPGAGRGCRSTRREKGPSVAVY